MTLARRIGRSAFKVSRAAGDVGALQRSPAVYAKRRVRRAVTRRVLGRWR